MPRQRRFAILILLLAVASPAHAGDSLWTAKTQTMSREIVAYATVEPRSVLRLRVGIAGVVADLKVQPGDAIAAGAELGQLTGPSVDALLAARRAELAAAGAVFKAAEQELAITREKVAGRLSTRSAMARDRATLSDAQAKRDSARAALSAVEEMASIRAPRAGLVLKVDAFSGERVAAGATLLTMISENDLWLRAAFYGADADAVSAGMVGKFVPAGGGRAIPVTVRTVVGALRPDGGRVVNLEPIAVAPGWVDGQTGTVTLDAGALSGVAVPTRALILDRAKWWVLVHSAKGDVQQEVTPGPSDGTLTLITRGLASGSAVVVENAYLEFHRGISGHYQPPD
jgi:multidrug efflux pump subunit AcrA (membrane-fusion protein)